jgi:hypothetical protein
VRLYVEVVLQLYSHLRMPQYIHAHAHTHHIFYFTASHHVHFQNTPIGRISINSSIHTLSSRKMTGPRSSKLKKTASDGDKLRLLDGISQVQRQYLQMEEPRRVFGTLLDNLLSLMDSEYGFIGEVKYQVDENGVGTPYLQTHAITNIAWNAVTQQFYEDNVDSGLKFTNLNSLFGRVIVTAEPMIANDPASHPLACGIPEGHPPLNHFLGIPFFEAQKDTTSRGPSSMVGMVGIANKVSYLYSMSPSTILVFVTLSLSLLTFVFFTSPGDTRKTMSTF